MNQKNDQNRNDGMANDLHRLLEFAQPNPLTLSEEELDAELSDMGIDFAAFSKRLDERIERTKRKSLLENARISLESSSAKARGARKQAIRSAQEMRDEITSRLEGLGTAGHSQAKAYFSKYEHLPDEDLPDFLRDLESLDEDNDANDMAEHC